MAPRHLILLAAVLAAALPPLLLLAVPEIATRHLVPVILAAALAAAVAALFWARPLADLARLAALLDALDGEAEAPPPRFGALFRRLGLTAAVRGLAERQQRRRERRRENVAEALLDALPDPLITLDGARRVSRLNPAARALLGDGAVGRELTQLLRQPELYAAIDDVERTGTPASVEVRVAGPFERHFHCQLSPAPSAGGTTAQVLVLLRDVTEVRRTAEMRVDFVANASHEIRTPLATIVGCIETLLGPAREDAEARQRFLEIMRSQSERMTRLVEDLLSLSRIELNEHQPPSGRVDVGELLRRVIDEGRLVAESAGIEVGLIGAEAPPAVPGDADELEQVFHNLLDNALKYGAAGKRVEIETRAVGAGESARLAISVRDFGPGIAVEDRPRLTERFYRVDKARSRELGGTGLGLAIVKHIVNRHRGTLSIESELGRGSTFTVELPLAPLS